MCSQASRSARSLTASALHREVDSPEVSAGLLVVSRDVERQRRSNVQAPTPSRSAPTLYTMTFASYTHIHTRSSHQERWGVDAHVERLLTTPSETEVGGRVRVMARL